MAEIPLHFVEITEVTAFPTKAIGIGFALRQVGEGSVEDFYRKVCPSCPLHVTNDKIYCSGPTKKVTIDQGEGVLIGPGEMKLGELDTNGALCSIAFAIKQYASARLKLRDLAQL